MKDLQHVTNHADLGVAKLIQAFKGKPRFEAMLRSYLNRVQEVEDSIFQFFIYSAIDSAYGATLDAIGALVGEKRQGNVDADYRGFIRARIKVNKSHGRIDELNSIVRLILNPAYPIVAREGFPLAYDIYVKDPATTTLQYLVFSMLKKAVGASISLVYYYTSDVPANMLTLTYSTTGIAPAINGATQGMGWSADTSVGGKLGGSIYA